MQLHYIYTEIHQIFLACSMLNHSYVYDTVMSVAYDTLDTPQN